MKSYVAIASLRGPVRTASLSELGFTVGRSQITVGLANLIERNGDGWLEKGIRLEMAIPSPSLDEAYRLAELTANLVSPMVALSAAAEITRSTVELVYEDAPDRSEGELFRVSDAELPELKLRKVYLHHLEPLFVGLATVDKRARDRVLRCLSWYQRGVAQAEPINRFTMLWTALEALDPLLSERWMLTAQDRACPHCGASLGKAAGLLSLRKLLEEIPEVMPDGYRRARRVRNDILHGVKHTHEVSQEALSVMPMLEAAVARGVARYFRLEKEAEDSLARPTLPSLVRQTIQVRMLFERQGRADLGVDGFHPHVNVVSDADIQWDDSSHPSSAVFNARLSLVAASSLRPKAVSVTACIRGQDLPVQKVSLEQSTRPLAAPQHELSEVQLWERRAASFIWKPTRR